METRDDVQHDILLIIGTAIFIFMATGILKPMQAPISPIIIS